MTPYKRTFFTSPPYTSHRAACLGAPVLHPTFCTTMASQSYNLGHSAYTPPTNGFSDQPLSPQSPYRQRAAPRTSRRRQSARHHTKRASLPHDGLRRPLEDVTDIVLARDYPWSRVPWQCLEVSTANLRQSPVVGNRWPQRNDALSAPWLELSPNATDGSKRVRWADLEDGDNDLLSPPATPRLGRLKTPELEPIKASRSFCTCCQASEVGYQRGREKMDAQREFVAPIHGRLG